MLSTETQLIGGIGLTEVRVYDQRPAPDGKTSGSPHVHGVTDEAYYVLEGSGEVELHSLDQGFRRLPLEQGQYVSFPPLVLHRIISHDGLKVLSVMGNSGLPEHGDARIYFGKAVDDDPERFAAYVGLPAEKGLQGALERRDLSVSAYIHLLDLWDTDRDGYMAELRRFLDAHLATIRDKKEEFATIIQQGSLACGQRALRRLEGDQQPETPGDCYTHSRGTDTAFGMCGTLHPVLTLNQIGGNEP